MSKRGMDFLELWMAANVKAGGNSAELAIRCAADAMKAGLTWEEIEEEAGRPLDGIHRPGAGSPGRWPGPGDRK